MKKDNYKTKEHKKLKVAAYCRVSTKQERQQFSLGYQEEYYYKLINSNENWDYAGIYIDVASGTNQKKRSQFEAMIKACLKHKIDLIIVKSVSRFGRNTLEGLQTTRLLKQNGVDVYFETAGLWIQKMDFELPLSIMFAIAQEESVDKSRAVKWGIDAGFKSGDSKIADKICYGYKKDINGRLIVDTVQSKTVTDIFTWYIEGYSLRKIADKLYENGISSPTGKEKWTPRAISKILSNEKYTGDVILQKTYIKDFWNHTQADNNGEFPKYLYENNNPPIISKEVFEQVQKSLIERSNTEISSDGKQTRKSTRYSSSDSLSGKVRCGICGKNFRRITTHSGNIVWRCASRVEKGKTKCTSPTVKQEELIEEINRATNISDLYLDFLIEYVDFIEICEFDISVTLKEISKEKLTELLHKQDHWLAYYSMQSNIKAKELLFYKHEELLKNKLRHLQKISELNNADIEDLEQTVWLRVYSRLPNYNSQYRFWTWMKQIVRSEFYLIKKRGRKYLLSEECLRIKTEEIQMKSKNNIDEWISSDYVKSLLSVLDDREREVVIRHLLNGEKQNEISEDFNVTFSRVNQIYWEAIENIKIFMNKI